MRIPTGIVAAAVVAAGLVTPARAQAPAVRPAPEGWERAHEGAVRAGADRQAAALALPVAPGDDVDNRAYLLDGGDLNGDGRTDLLDVRTQGVPRDSLDGMSTEWHYTTTVDAHRGSDGSVLWRRTFGEDERVYVIPARVGPAAKAGVLFLVYGGRGEAVDADEVFGVAGASTLRLLAVDGAGTDVWDRRLGGGYGWGFGPVGYADAATRGYVADSGQLRGNASQDLLVQVYASGFGDVPVGGAGGEASRVLVVDGADGLVADTGIGAIDPDGWIDPMTLPDVSGDKLDDILAVFRASGEPDALEAHRGTDGLSLWTAETPESWFSGVASLGDLTRDGVVDFAYVGYDFDTEEEVSYVFDGKSGDERWHRTGWPLPLPGRREVVLVRESGFGEASVRAEAVDASGRVRWRFARSIPVPKGSTPSPDPDEDGPIAVVPSSAYGTAGEVGDVNGDGVSDLEYVLTVGSASGMRRDSGWVDGASGRAHPTPVPRLELLGGQALDGRGTDAVVLASAGSTLTVSAYAGDSYRQLWRTAVSVGGAYASSAYAGFARRLSSARCADLVVTVPGEAKQLAVVFSAHGVPLWSVSRDGGSAAPTVAKPPARSRTDRNSCR